MKNRMKYCITRKALALGAAIDSGLLPKIEDGWDDTKFNKFWEMYEEYLSAYFDDKTCKRNRKPRERAEEEKNGERRF